MSDSVIVILSVLCERCLLDYCLAPCMYLQVVAPKKERLAEAEKSFSETMSALNAKRAELKEVNSSKV